jgi:hypothetical protein
MSGETAEFGGRVFDIYIYIYIYIYIVQQNLWESFPSFNPTRDHKQNTFQEGKGIFSCFILDARGCGYLMC